LFLDPATLSPSNDLGHSDRRGTWPLMLRLQAYFGGRRGLAVTLMTLALLLVLLVPLTVAIGTIAQNADRIIGWAKSLASLQ
jgi:predicted PurR-regulated permease PerM